MMRETEDRDGEREGQGQRQGDREGESREAESRREGERTSEQEREPTGCNLVAEGRKSGRPGYRYLLFDLGQLTWLL